MLWWEVCKKKLKKKLKSIKLYLIPEDNMFDFLTFLKVYEEGDGKIFRIDDIYITGLLAEHTTIRHR